VIGVVSGEWDGLEGLGEEALEQVRGEAVAVVTEAADYFVGELKTTLTGQRSGRLYRVIGGKTLAPAMIGPRVEGKPPAGPIHQASAPGEAPAVLFGPLRNSIGRTEAKVVDGYTVEAEVGVGLGVKAEDNAIAENYAARLEFGGVDSRGRRILPRPYMGPTRDRVEPVIADMFANATGSKG
jgi:hypothetical protein